MSDSKQSSNVLLVTSISSNFKMYEDSKCYCGQCGQVYGSIRDLKRHEKLEHYD